MKAYRLMVAATLATAIGALVLISGEGGNMGQRLTPAAAQSSLGGELTSLNSATAWLNSQPLTAADLRGKVVLVAVLWLLACAPSSGAPGVGLAKR